MKKLSLLIVATLLFSSAAQANPGNLHQTERPLAKYESTKKHVKAKVAKKLKEKKITEIEPIPEPRTLPSAQ